jgi:hypothetical protein
MGTNLIAEALSLEHGPGGKRCLVHSRFSFERSTSNSRISSGASIHSLLAKGFIASMILNNFSRVSQRNVSGGYDGPYVAVW